MPFVVTENCINCKLGDCIEVCPVDCFYEGENMVVINPEECIDCALCESECPVNAIYSDEELPQDQIEFSALNLKLSQKYRNISEKCQPCENSNDWLDVKDKRKYLLE